AHLLNEKNKKKTRLPIINAVYAVLYEGKNPKNVFQKLTEQLD
ncbi:MAG TPA: glycerol-3-phosphate dehydrogenase, partial [Flavobacteriaceae bacterium]|nr:glycerol-3-phosphate dehydrogenase [Flavobacteriaceae bacterium]